MEKKKPYSNVYFTVSMLHVTCRYHNYCIYSLQ